MTSSSTRVAFDTTLRCTGSNTNTTNVKDPNAHRYMTDYMTKPDREQLIAYIHATLEYYRLRREYGRNIKAQSDRGKYMSQVLGAGSKATSDDCLGPQMCAWALLGQLRFESSHPKRDLWIEPNRGVAGGRNVTIGSSGTLLVVIDHIEVDGHPIRIGDGTELPIVLHGVAGNDGKAALADGYIKVTLRLGRAE